MVNGIERPLDVLNNAKGKETKDTKRSKAG